MTNFRQLGSRHKIILFNIDPTFSQLRADWFVEVLRFLARDGFSNLTQICWMNALKTTLPCIVLYGFLSGLRGQLISVYIRDKPPAAHSKMIDRGV